jgi:hypothetical protein
MTSNDKHDYGALRGVVEGARASAFNAVGGLTQENQQAGVRAYQGSADDLLEELEGIRFTPDEDVIEDLKLPQSSSSLDGAIAAMRRGIDSICEWWNSLPEPGQEQTVGPIKGFFARIVNAFSFGASAKSTTGSLSGGAKPRYDRAQYARVSPHDSDADSSDDEKKGEGYVRKQT